MEKTCDVLGKAFNLPLLPLLDLLVVEAREHMLLMHLIELPRLLCNVGQVLGYLVLDVEPARRQQVHFDDGITVVLEGVDEPLALLVAEAIVAWGLLSRMVRVRLAVGDEAVEATSVHACRHGCGCGGRTAYRFVRSRHMVGRQVAGTLCHGMTAGEDSARAVEVGELW